MTHRFGRDLAALQAGQYDGWTRAYDGLAYIVLADQMSRHAPKCYKIMMSLPDEGAYCQPHACCILPLTVNITLLVCSAGTFIGENQTHICLTNGRYATRKLCWCDRELALRCRMPNTIVCAAQ